MRLLSFFVLLLSLNTVYAKKIKIAVLAPEGTSWANSLADMSKEIKQETKGSVEFKIYYGGVAGDESDVLKKIHINQFHGGFFTGKTLGDIFGDIRAVEIPFAFHHDKTKAWKALGSFEKYFNDGLEKKGFHNLGFYEIGQVYLVSTKKVNSIAELKGIKIWSWEGDPLVNAMVDSLKLISVPLSLPDVLSSLSTGIIDAAYAPPLAIIALQWQSKIKFLIDYPVAFSIGALLVKMEHWKSLNSNHKQIVMKIAKKYIEQTNIKTREDNDEALKILKTNGIGFINLADTNEKSNNEIRRNVVDKVKNKVISQETINKLEKMIR